MKLVWRVLIVIGLQTGVGLFGGLYSIAALASLDSIMDARRACLDQPESASQIGKQLCDAAAVKGLQGEISKVLAAKKAELDSKLVAALENSQRTWESYRAAELKFVELSYGGQGSGVGLAERELEIDLDTVRLQDLYRN